MLRAMPGIPHRRVGAAAPSRWGLRSFRRSLLCSVMAVLVSPALPAAGADDSTTEDLTKLPIEQLMNIEVTSAAKNPQRLSDATSAIFVLTHDDIERSGMTTIPDLLRMVPGVQVAQINANSWAVTARGFASRFADKMLVLVDGRTVYDPLFSGVFWDRQDVVIDDIERIEVIRGPGAALWGANAVNGVVNIITKSSSDTKGALVSVGAGTAERADTTVRYGAAIDKDTTARVFANYYNYYSSTAPGGLAGNDAWQNGRVGFRADGKPATTDSWTLEGEYFSESSGQTVVAPSLAPPFSRNLADTINATEGDFLGRWNHVFDDHSVLKVQAYFDHTTEADQAVNAVRRDTVDLDIQHHFTFGDRQDVTWGVGYRETFDHTSNSRLLVGALPEISFNPTGQTYQLFNTFVQDTLAVIPDSVYVTLGSKLEHNSYTGFEVDPSVRLRWTPTPTQTVWGAVSRATRTPSRTEEDVQSVDSVAGGIPVVTTGSNDLKSETLLAYELGYRIQPASTVSLDTTVFYNHYDNLISSGPPTLVPVPGLFPGILELPLVNLGEANAYGLELAANWEPLSWWRLRPSYTLLVMRTTEDTLIPGSQSPRNQAGLRSLFDLTPTMTLDGFAHYVDSLPGLHVPAYAELDMRLGWRPQPNLELSLLGQNLLHDRHMEFGSEDLPTIPTYVQRSGMVRATLRF
jgi:iron complex outermembrane recepter protein